MQLALWPSPARGEIGLALSADVCTRVFGGPSGRPDLRVHSSSSTCSVPGRGGPGMGRGLQPKSSRRLGCAWDFTAGPYSPGASGAGFWRAGRAGSPPRPLPAPRAPSWAGFSASCKLALPVDPAPCPQPEEQVSLLGLQVCGPTCSMPGSHLRALAVSPGCIGLDTYLWY